MNELDKYIISIIDKKIEKKESYYNAINNALYKEKNFYYKYKFILAISTCFLIITGVVYAIEVGLKNNFNYNNGVSKAIENGFIDEAPNTKIENSKNMVLIEKDYVQDEKIVEENNNMIKVKVDPDLIDTSNLIVNKYEGYDCNIDIDSFTMDSYHINIIFKVEVDKFDLDKIRRMRINDMIIYDEKMNIIYCSDKEKFNNFCTENKLDYQYLEFNEHYYNNEENGYILKKDDNYIYYVFNIGSNFDYPKCRYLNFSIGQVNFTEKEISSNEEYELYGNWNIKYNVPKKFYNRNEIVYKVKSCSDSRIEVTKACLYNSGFVIEFISSDEPIFYESDSTKVKKEKSDKFMEDREKDRFISDEYLEDQDGNKYYSVNDGTQTSGTIYEIDGKFKHWQTFDMILEEGLDCDEIKYEFYCTLHGENRVIEVVLVKK